MSNTTIISKCGNPIPLGKKMLRRVKQITLPNVGRNDNTIAHVMSTISKDPKSFENHMIVFLKDNLKLHQKAMPRSLTDMLNVASVNGFGCFLKPREGISMYHDTETLQKFNLTLYRPEKTSNDNSNFKSPYSNMGEWLQTTLGGGLRLPSPFTPVCYGGTFAVQASRIAAIPSTIFDQIESSLSRSDNIEEGHFAERMWAGLLSIPPTEGETTIMRKRHKRINFELSKDGGGQLGALMI
ncbi:unnamed protein product [Cylindrotheca closterium]|uniref:Uncharacterized protein n=1 Tax=Cylindrotheca closterium TaxID=2856 RepID=A0AAD2CBU0_9STRA|nr:unnamed protein product [Cylindrotheca closterium]